MTKTGNSGLFVVLFCMVLFAGLGALVLLSSAQVTTVTIFRAEAVAVPSWLDGRQTTIEQGLSVSPHAVRHSSELLDAERIYGMLLQGKCAAADQFCGPDGKRLYLCFDPITGLLGGIFVKDGIIESGWGSRPVYWAGKVRGVDAPYKASMCYH